MCAWIHYIHISTGPISVKNPDQIRSRDSYCRWRHSSPQTSSPVESCWVLCEATSQKRPPLSRIIILHSDTHFPPHTHQALTKKRALMLRLEFPFASFFYFLKKEKKVECICSVTIYTEDHEI